MTRYVVWTQRQEVRRLDEVFPTFAEVQAYMATLPPDTMSVVYTVEMPDNWRTVGE